MDNQLLLGSVIINCLLIIERILSKTKKSECCGAKFEMASQINSQKSEINLSNIKIDEPVSNIKHIEGKTLDFRDESVKSV